MEVIRGLTNIKDKHKGAVVTVGNFDGVHTGHRTILLEMKRKASELKTKTLLICFEPQPREFFDYYNAPARLTRLKEKVELLDDLGIDIVLCLKFDESFKETTAERFIEILGKDLAAQAVFVGDDSRFGQDRAGNFDQLQSAGEQYGFSVFNFETITHGDDRVSSTRIRECLDAGEFDMAERLLGHPYFITGKVIYGRQIGRTLGVPTMNVQLHRYVAPIAGVFACECLVRKKMYQGVANVGVRPTLDIALLKPVLEVHLFDFNDTVYGDNVKVIFRLKIRDEKKFEGLDELKTAINADIQTAKNWFG